MPRRRNPPLPAAGGVASTALPQPPAATEAVYAPAVKAGFHGVTGEVQRMHQAIAAKTFDSLQQVPGLAVPSVIVRAVHDAITHGVYAAVRHGGSAALTVAGLGERLVTDPAQPIAGRELSLRSAINGVFGDALARSGSALALNMGFHAGGAPLPLTRAALGGLRPRVVVFIHGLACDEQSWLQNEGAWASSECASVLPAGERIHYGSLLDRELGTRSIYLRYNTGLPIEANALRFAALLIELMRAAPQVRELVLVGHSMGGLVARRAWAIAASEGQVWAASTAMVICLGSPHQGAGLAKLGEIASAMLMATDVTRPLGRIAEARSQGVKDLRHGLAAVAPDAAPDGLLDEAPSASTVPLRLVYATLGNASEAADSPGGAWMGKLFGDGLVHAASAADDGLTGDVQRVEITGLGHMGLLGDPRVYAQIRRWVGGADLV